MNISPNLMPAISTEAAPAGKVSVVVTCFNLAAYIGDAIASVLEQEFAGEIEIIVVDDCSTDGSAEIVKRFPRVRYIRQPANGGVLLATIAGLEAASHDIVAFLDGDDLWELGKVDAVAAAFAAAPLAALVTHDLRYADAAGRAIARLTRPEQVLTRADPAKREQLVRDGILRHGDYVWLGSALAVRRSLAECAEFIAFARALPDPANTYQDWPLAFWIASLAGARLAYVPKKLFRYRLHDAHYSGDAATAAKALRNLTRTRNTCDAMRRIAVLRGLPPDIVRSTERQRHFAAALVDLYSGRRGRAARTWLRSLPLLIERGLLLKETARFAAIQLLGAERFSTLRKAQRRRQSVTALPSPENCE
jgi:glycosyltransferase involved in cell wall biosynthesis